MFSKISRNKESTQTNNDITLRAQIEVSIPAHLILAPNGSRREVVHYLGAERELEEIKRLADEQMMKRIREDLARPLSPRKEAQKQQDAEVTFHIHKPAQDRGKEKEPEALTYPDEALERLAEVIWLSIQDSQKDVTWSQPRQRQTDPRA